MRRLTFLAALALLAASAAAAQDSVSVPLDGYGAVKEGAMIGPDRQYLDGFAPPVPDPENDLAPDAEAGDHPSVTRPVVLAVDVLVDAGGRIEEIRVGNTGVDPVWSSRVLDAICRWKFVQPGVLDGQPVAVWLLRRAWRFMPP